MINLPATFRRAIEFLYGSTHLSPFIEAASESLEALFENEQLGLTPEQEKQRATQKAKAIAAMQPKYPKIDFKKEDTDKVLGMYSNYIRYGTIYPPASSNDPKPIPATTQPQPAEKAQTNPPAKQNAGATAGNAAVDISNHTVAKPSRETMICILNRHYKNNKENLETWGDDKLFAAYRQGIMNGAIPYDISRGYLGGACPTPVPPPPPPQTNANPLPSKPAKFTAGAATDMVNRLRKSAGK